MFIINLLLCICSADLLSDIDNAIASHGSNFDSSELYERYISVNGMSKAGKSDEVIKAENALERAKERLRQTKHKESKRLRRERDTALYTLGACFAAMLNDDRHRVGMLKLWNDHMSSIAPKLFTDNRRAALKSQFDLDPRDL